MNIILRKVNEVYVKVDADYSIKKELWSYFSFNVPNAKFLKNKSGYKHWDGKIRLFNMKTGTLFYGLIKRIEEFAKERNYTLSLDESINPETDFSLYEATQFLKSLQLPFEIRKYQAESFVRAIRRNRQLFVCPTASGKSLIIYCIIEWYRKQGLKCLLVTPRVSLVQQMKGDFVSYGGNINHYHELMGGKEQDSNCPVIISTWQSIYKNDKKWFKQFDVIIGDECHQFQAKSLQSLMKKTELCKYKFGLTGTLDDTLVHQSVLEGLFGTSHKVIGTSELIDKGYLSDLKINALLLVHPPKDCVDRTYQEEMEFLAQNEPRNKFIKNLALSIEVNTLILYRFVEKHGKVLYDLIKKESDQRKVFFIHGGVVAEERERVRKLVESENDAIIVASYGTFSTGINMKKLNNIIMASPNKGKIINLQSIGRGLRRSDEKIICTLFDIADDLSKRNGDKNYTLNHFKNRLLIYNKEKFNYDIHKVKMKTKKET